MEELKKRKTTRLKGADYDHNKIVFLTICTQNRRCILSRIVGTGVLDGPSVSPYIELTHYGKIADKYINQLNAFYDNISVENYVIMPNHIHILLWIKNEHNETTVTDQITTTAQNTITARFLSTFKRFCNKECGENIWQYRSYDHIIRNRKDYEEHLQYIHQNPAKWFFDELYADDSVFF